MENEKFEALLKWSLEPEHQVKGETMQELLGKMKNREVGGEIKGKNGMEAANGTKWLNGMEGANGIHGGNGMEEVKGISASYGMDETSGLNMTNGTDDTNGINGMSRTNTVNGKHLALRWSLPKVAVLILLIVVIGAGSVYAGSRIFNKITVTEKEITVGEPLGLTLEDFDGEDAESATKVSHEKGGPDDKWMEKDVEYLEPFTITTYSYRNYETALEEVHFDNVFEEVPERIYSVQYRIHDRDGVEVDYRLSVGFDYHNGSVWLSEFEDVDPWRDGQTAESLHFSIITSGFSNERTYVSKRGTEYSLADTEYDTIAILSMDRMVIDLSFRNLSEEEIYQILDMLVL